MNLTITKPLLILKEKVLGHGNKIYVEGDEHTNTHDLKLFEIKTFLERDLFLSVKNKILPPYDYQLQMKAGWKKDFLLKVFHKGSKCEGELRSYIKQEFEKIIAKYNIEVFSTFGDRASPLAKGLSFDIDFAHSR